MAKNYYKRAEAIHQLLTATKQLVDTSTAYSDRMAAIMLSVEVVNTLLYTFDFAKQVNKDISKRLNDHFILINDEADINRLISKVQAVLQDLIQEASALMKEYGENK